MALLRKGNRGPQAIATLREVVRLAPEHGAGHWSLARALAVSRQGRESWSHMSRAVELLPDRPDILRDAAWMLATYPDPDIRNGAEAVRLAERAARMGRPDDAMTQDTLAAAFAETGDFQRAVSTARNAAISARAGGRPGLAAQIQQRLDLYLNGRPYHEAP